MHDNWAANHTTAIASSPGTNRLPPAGCPRRPSIGARSHAGTLTSTIRSPTLPTNSNRRPLVPQHPRCPTPHRCASRTPCRRRSWMLTSNTRHRRPLLIVLSRSGRRCSATRVWGRWSGGAAVGGKGCLPNLAGLRSNRGWPISCTSFIRLSP